MDATTPPPAGAVGSPRYVVRRDSRAAPPLPEALLRATRVGSGWWRPEAPAWHVGEPPRPLAASADAVAAHLDAVRRARRAGAPAIVRIADDARAPAVAFFLDADLEADDAPEATLWLSVPEAFLRTRAPDAALRLLGDLAEAFGAHHGHLEDPRLAVAYRGARAAERARAAVPPELRAHVPDPLPAGVAPPGLPPLLVPDEFDHARVPDGVWWINHWGPEQVRAVGERRAREAGWARVVDAPGGGGLLLAATEEPVDVARPDHVARLRGILERLDLPALQRRHARRGRGGG